jgi:sugar/nucleoside kinase (ribokinase family)
VSPGLPGHPRNPTNRSGPSKNLGAVLERFLTEENLTNAELARQVGVNADHLRKLRRGDSVLSSTELINEVEQVINYRRWSDDQRFRLQIAYKQDLAETYEPADSDAEESFDFIGIGALNFDELAQKPEYPPTYGGSNDQEVRVDDEDGIRQVKEEIKASSYEPVLGGSTFNTTIALACSDLGCKTGYIGVSGSWPSDITVKGSSEHSEGLKTHLQVLGDAGCDCRFVQHVEATGGWCVSVMWDRQRRMRTYPGANSLLAPFLVENFFPIADFLCSAQLVHVTSLFDELSPPLVVSLLGIVNRCSPRTIISLDPGYDWCTKHPDLLEAFFPHLDLLFLSEDEFDAVSTAFPPSGTGLAVHSSRGKADAIRLRLRRRGSVVVVKRAGETSIYTQGEPIEKALGSLLDPEDIVDDTGAGDAFAAGYLAMHLAEGAAQHIGAMVGMQLARRKLLQSGPVTGPTLGEIVKHFGAHA